jgi:hypothetical protein
MASGALMTGDAKSGYSLQLRPVEPTSQGSEGLRRFMEIVNGSSIEPTAEPSTPPTSGAPHPPSPEVKYDSEN